MTTRPAQNTESWTAVGHEVFTTKGLLICTAHGFNSTVRADRARLIAKAPEMLKDLVHAVEMFALIRELLLVDDVVGARSVCLRTEEFLGLTIAAATGEEA